MARRVPVLEFERDSDKLISHYQRAYVEVLDALSQMIGIGDFSYSFEQKLLNQITRILVELDKDNEAWCRRYIEKYFRDGAATVLVEAGVFNSISEAKNGLRISELGGYMMNAHISDTYEDLLSVTKNTDRKVKRLVKQVASQTIRAKALQKIGRKTMERDIYEELTRQGLSKQLEKDGWVGIVDAAGRRWNLTTYVKMVTRTKLQQAHVEGVRVEAQERGIDTGVISSHGAEDHCRHFEGMVISLNGLTPGLLTYEELRKSNLIFHPNCQHTIRPIRDIKLLATQLREKHAEQLKNAHAVLERGRRAA